MGRGKSRWGERRRDRGRKEIKDERWNSQDKKREELPRRKSVKRKEKEEKERSEEV